MLSQANNNQFSVEIQHRLPYFIFWLRAWNMIYNVAMIKLNHDALSKHTHTEQLARIAYFVYGLELVSSLVDLTYAINLNEHKAVLTKQPLIFAAQCGLQLAATAVAITSLAQMPSSYLSPKTAVDTLIIGLAVMNGFYLLSASYIQHHRNKPNLHSEFTGNAYGANAHPVLPCFKALQHSSQNPESEQVALVAPV